MNIEHMTQMVRMLKEVQADQELARHFNLRAFVGGDVTGNYKHAVVKCGTTACACGYAAFDEYFISHGFVYESDLVNVSYTHPGESGPVRLLGWNAIEQFFELQQDEAQFLFDQYEYNIKIENGKDALPYVIERIEGVLDGSIQFPASFDYDSDDCMDF